MSVKRLLIFVLFVSGPVLGQHLLFKSGFESNTSLSSIPSKVRGPSGYTQYITGTDLSTGYTWCASTFPFRPSYCGIHLEPYNSDYDAEHFTNYLDPSSAHSGRQSLKLSVHGYPNESCCGQQVIQTSNMATPMKSLYQRFWLYLPASLSSVLSTVGRGNYYWTSVSGFKTMDDYRFALNFFTYDGRTLHEHIQADPGGISASNGAGCPYRDAITGERKNDCDYHFADVDNTVISMPLGQWILVEYYFVRSAGPDGRFFAAIDGKTVTDWSGPNYGTDSEEIQDMYYHSNYSNYYPVTKWIDDWEVWDGPPCRRLPCGTVTGAGGTGFSGTVPPSITSYRGTIGAVGVPFHYQITAVHGPTSYQVNNGSLPSGLSLNQRTGLISGTPTTAGTSTVWLQVYNSAGKGAQPLEIQINKVVAAPIIHDLWASPGAARGSPVKLSWNVLGAGNVRLSINQGVGAVTGMSGSRIVKPKATLTYTLTATNSAGSTSKSVRVAVNGSVTTPVPPTGITATVH